jgi:hypothetical protein
VTPIYAVNIAKLIPGINGRHRNQTVLTPFSPSGNAENKAVRKKNPFVSERYGPVGTSL